MWSEQHDTELAWYFLQSTSVLGDRSTFGGQLAALERASADSDGHRIPAKSSVDADVWRARSAQVFAGWDAVSEWDHSLDAQPTQGRDRGHDGYVPDDRDLRRFAEVSRALRVMSSSELAALACWYLHGERWQAGKLGRYIAVMTEVPAGKRLLNLRKERREKAGSCESELRADECVAAEVRDDEVRTDIQRRALIVSANNQARVLVGAAQASYSAARGAPP
jgi:hypothetical protein